MKKIGFITSFLLGILTAAFVALPVASHLELNPAPIAAGLFAMPFAVKFCVNAYYGFMPRQSNFAYMAVQKENWVDYIMKNLFKDNEFLTKCYDESDSVLNGSVVHIPQTGAKPTIVKNRSSYPATAVQRTDTDVTYAIDNYTSDPTHIQFAEEKEASYDKMDSVLGEHMEAMNEAIAEDLLYKWAPTTAGTIHRTTGAVADAIALAPGATGTRKPLTLADLRAAKVKMNKAGIAKADRYALIPEDMLSQLMADTALTNSYTQQLMDLKEGTVPKIEGFLIYTRANASIYDNTGTPVPKLITAATAVTDNLSVLCWQKNAVCKARGTVDFFENKKDALYHGDVYSIGVRCGGRKRRTNAEGVIAIVQTT
ncbi:phage capsid protein [Aurantibacillus circumpalustris]|uniref:phage capsid protein n=1 Tax=Aurantibacillus circumpalustris TaxID=3036359 RepID=UPI00295ABCA9|nr:phage capsid protein [Aurantibacillus circumpalustris]